MGFIHRKKKNKQSAADTAGFDNIKQQPSERKNLVTGDSGDKQTTAHDVEFSWNPLKLRYRNNVIHEPLCSTGAQQAPPAQIQKTEESLLPTLQALRAEVGQLRVDLEAAKQAGERNPSHIRPPQSVPTHLPPPETYAFTQPSGSRHTTKKNPKKIPARRHRRSGQKPHPSTEPDDSDYDTSGSEENRSRANPRGKSYTKERPPVPPPIPSPIPGAYSGDDTTQQEAQHNGESPMSNTWNNPLAVAGTAAVVAAGFALSSPVVVGGICAAASVKFFADAKGTDNKRIEVEAQEKSKQVQAETKAKMYKECLEAEKWYAQKRLEGAASSSRPLQIAGIEEV